MTIRCSYAKIHILLLVVPWTLLILHIRAKMMCSEMMVYIIDASEDAYMSSMMTAHHSSRARSSGSYQPCTRRSIESFIVGFDIVEQID